ncbi:MAG: serine/threonine-protein kinase [Bryobacteraceae bacterium]
MTIFEIGETKSGYKFLDVLKRSSHSVEYRVQNTLAQRLESMKVLSQLAAEDVQGAELFLREVRVRARLIHPNIVTLFSAIELDRRLAMTTELVEGPTLAECLQSGPLPWREAVRLAGQALSALSFAHRQHVVHRDINPENIVIAPGGVLKLTNFSLAKSEVSPKLTQVGAIVGNLKCISPEQVKGTGEADARSDLYSLGVVLFEMICGRPPFESRSQFELMTAHVNQPPPRPSEWNCTIPPEIDEIVLKSLAKDPACRYQTASEFAEALVQAVAVIDRLYPAAEPAGEEVCPVRSWNLRVPWPRLPDRPSSLRPNRFPSWPLLPPRCWNSRLRWRRPRQPRLRKPGLRKSTPRRPKRWLPSPSSSLRLLPPNPPLGPPRPILSLWSPPSSKPSRRPGCCPPNCRRPFRPSS